MKATSLLPLILWAVLLKPLPLCAGAEEDYQSAQRAYERLLTDKSRQKFRDAWEPICGRFEKIADQYPSHKRAALSLFRLGEIYRKIHRISFLKSDLEKAAGYCETLVERYPRSTLADDALFSIGEIHLKRNRKTEAWKAFDRAAREYPKGDFAARAREKREALAEHRPREVFPQPSAAKEAELVQILDVDYLSDEDSTKVLIDLREPIDFVKNQLPGDPRQGIDPRVFVDLPGAKLPKDIEDRQVVNDGLVKSLRSGQNQMDRARVVLDLHAPVESEIYALQLEDRWRLILQVYRQGAAPAASTEPAPLETLDLEEINRLLNPDLDPAAPPPAIESPPTLPPEGKDLNLYQVLGANKIRRIAIDAGHGGHDPGAIGPGGIREKDVALDMARRLSKALQARGYSTYLVRDADRFVQLDFRVQLAKKAKADLFISVHCNAARNPKAHGLETYYLDPRAKDRSALETAALENAMSVESLSEVEFILRDMGRTARQKESKAFAQVVQRRLIRSLGDHYNPIKDLGVKGAPFRVLVGAQMPAILVETAFITNPTEAKRLVGEAYPKRLTEALAAGIHEYVQGMSLAGGSKP